MRRPIVLLSFLLAITLGWSNASLSELGQALTEGQQLAAAGDIKGALSVYEATARSHPDSHEAFAQLGGMQLLDQRYADAVRSFQRAVTLGDDGTRSFIGMGMAYLHMGQPGPARAAFVEARARGGEHPTDIDDIIRWIDSRDRSAP